MPCLFDARLISTIKDYKTFVKAHDLVPPQKINNYEYAQYLRQVLLSYCQPLLALKEDSDFDQFGLHLNLIARDLTSLINSKYSLYYEMPFNVLIIGLQSLAQDVQEVCDFKAELNLIPQYTIPLESDALYRDEAVGEFEIRHALLEVRLVLTSQKIPEFSLSTIYSKQHENISELKMNSETLFDYKGTSIGFNRNPKTLSTHEIHYLLRNLLKFI